MSSDIQIQAKDIVRIYQGADGSDVHALEGMNLEVHKGEIVTIVGPSGCGKSTFLRLVAGLDTPQEGVIEQDGQPIQGINHRCGFMFQEANLFPWLTIYDNIAFGLKMTGELEKNKDKVNDYIKMMGLEGFESAYPYQVSGGMASRASLARTFIQEPEVILLDEPLSALDAFTRESLQEAILKIWNENKPSIISVTHDIEEAIYLAHKVVVMARRPSRVLREVSIELNHPRDRISEEFISYRRLVKNCMEGNLEDE